jgi:hypothetical protein
MADANQWIPVANSAIVGMSTILAIVVTQFWTSRRDQRAKQLEAMAQRQNQRDDFQRKTLLQLQLAVQGFARAAGTAHHHDNMHFKKTGTWSTMLPDDMDKNYSNSSMSMIKFSNRVLDKAIRERIDLTRGLSVSMLLADSKAEADDKSRLFTEQLNQLNDALGQLIREIL